MSPLQSLLVSSVVLLSSFASAQPRGEVVIQSRDGKVHLGRVISETSKGYLLATATGTVVIDFASIADVRQLVPSMPSPVAAVPVTAMPTAVVPVQSSPAEWSEVPPPPPVRPADDGMEVAAPVARPVKRERTGLHFGLGLNTALALPLDYSSGMGSSVDVELQGVLDLNFGRPGYRLALGLGGSSRENSPLTATVDNLFTFSFGDVYSLGAGLQVGGLFGANPYFQASTLLQPVVLRLGERGQHQLALTLAYCFLGNVHYPYWWNSLTSVTYAGTLRTNLGYTFLF